MSPVYGCLKRSEGTKVLWKGEENTMHGWEPRFTCTLKCSKKILGDAYWIVHLLTLYAAASKAQCICY